MLKYQNIVKNKDHKHIPIENICVKGFLSVWKRLLYKNMMLSRVIFEWLFITAPQIDFHKSNPSWVNLWIFV